jgi:hypothetical protein
MKKIEVVLDFARSTKGTHLYATDSGTAPVTSLYVKKFGMDEQPPAKIVVTLSIPEAD